MKKWKLRGTGNIFFGDNVYKRRFRLRWFDSAMLICECLQRTMPIANVSRPFRARSFDITISPEGAIYFRIGHRPMY
jgi:hypothetical protein